MRRYLTAFPVIAALCLSAGAAKADGDPNGECRLVKVCMPKKMKPKKKAPPPPVAETAPPPVCNCPPAPKPECPAPLPPVVQTITVTKTVLVPTPAPAAPAPEYFNIALGVMGSAQNTRHAWGWGPALQLRIRMAPRTEGVIDFGLAAGADGIRWSPGQTRAWMVQVGIAHYLRPWFALTGGVLWESIGVKPGWDSGSYLQAGPGVVFRKDLGPVTFRVDGKVLLGGSTYNSSNGDIDFIVGGVGTANLSYHWN